MKKEYLSQQENWAWFSVLFLSVIILRGYSVYMELLVYWIIVRLVMGNIRRIENNSKNVAIFLFRRFLYVLPLLLPLLFSYDIAEMMDITILKFTLGIILGFVILMTNWTNIRISISYDLIELTQRQSILGYVSYIILLISAAVLEELFFRAFIIDPNIPIISITLSTILFLTHHISVPWSDSFSKKDYFIQIIFSVLSSVLFIVTGSIIPSIVAHLLLNTPHIIQKYRCIRFHYFTN